MLAAERLLYLIHQQGQYCCVSLMVIAACRDRLLLVRKPVDDFADGTFVEVTTVGDFAVAKAHHPQADDLAISFRSHLLQNLEPLAGDSTLTGGFVRARSVGGGFVQRFFDVGSTSFARTTAALGVADFIAGHSDQVADHLLGISKAGKRIRVGKKGRPYHLDEIQGIEPRPKSFVQSMPDDPPDVLTVFFEQFAQRLLVSPTRSCEYLGKPCRVGHIATLTAAVTPAELVRPRTGASGMIRETFANLHNLAWIARPVYAHFWERRWNNPGWTIPGRAAVGGVGNHVPVQRGACGVVAW